MQFLLCLFLLAAPGPENFDHWFTGGTLRFDYYHNGIVSEEHISLDQIRAEGEWPGSRTHLIDDTNLGKYLFSVVDSTTNREIYSRGFASIYGEWETIGEAKKGIWRTFHESQRFPEPKNNFQLILKKRSPQGAFVEIYTQAFDPKSRFVDRSALPKQGTVWNVVHHGNPSTKVDFLILGEGYAAEQQEKFRKDVKRLTDVLFEYEPYRALKEKFNVWAIDLVSQAPGISNPRKNFWNATPLGLSFNAFDVDRYVLTYKNKELREIAAQASYDALIILYNDRKYGGGGIFNLWATCSADTAVADYVFVHELGHSFAGLADEYYSSSVAYEDFVPAGSEPWEPNITALLNPKELKWKDLVDQSTPLPTPWNQEKYDKASYDYQKKREKMVEQGAAEEAMEALFQEVKEVTGPMLSSEAHAGKVGAFEGGGYQAKGLYRPEADCIMFTRNPDHFCRVCTQAIRRVIELYAE